MGLYLEGSIDGSKVAYILKNAATARTISHPPISYKEVPVGFKLVCVAYNGSFEAAAVISDNREFKLWTVGWDRRLKTWILVSKDEIKKLLNHRLVA